MPTVKNGATRNKKWRINLTSPEDSPRNMKLWKSKEIFIVTMGTDRMQSPRYKTSEKKTMCTSHSNESSQ